MLDKRVIKRKSIRSKLYNKFLKSNIKARRYTVAALVSSLLLTTIIIGLRKVGVLQTLELVSYDRMTRSRKSKDRDPRLLLVEITDRDIEQQNKWPISDGVIAKALSNLQQHNPKVIGLDLYRDIEYPPGIKALEKELEKENVIAIEYLGTPDKKISPPSVVPQERVGFNDFVLDPDNILRRSLIYGRSKERSLYSFSLLIALKYLEDPQKQNNSQLKITPSAIKIQNTVFERLKSSSGGYNMKPSESLGWQILLKYKPSNFLKKVTLEEVLSGNVDPNLIKDKAVIIGTTASSVEDSFYTPYKGSDSYISGVIAHTLMVSQIIESVLGESQIFWFWSETVEILWIAFWCFLGSAIAIRLKSPLTILLTGGLSVGGLYYICNLFFIGGGWIPFVPTAIGFTITSASVLTYKICHTLFYDSLTGLPNRRLFRKQIAQLHKKNCKTEKDACIVIFCLDLDRFKLINDALGYQSGDTLLLTTAEKLREYFSFGEPLARVGGDEFAIATIIPDEPESAIKIVNELQKKLTLPFDVEGKEILTHFTVGIALSKLDGEFKPENLLRSARTAMYTAKASGKSRHKMFATKMHEQALDRLRLEADLYEAIKNQEFVVYYQPIICLETQKVAGFEALVRWISPQRGFISPGQFIPIAEETGAIIPLGEWVLTEACTTMYQWKKENPENRDIFISVNLSGKQFAQANLVEKIEKVLQKTNLRSQNLKLEITESMLMDNIEAAIEMLNRLKALGINLSMDDFGTGFSSFSYLHRFPIDTLKVDRSFVSKMNETSKNLQIVSNIILLAHKLDLDVVAEGIETEEEKEVLQGLNCKYGQGYLFAKPLPSEDAKKFLKSQFLKSQNVNG